MQNKNAEALLGLSATAIVGIIWALMVLGIRIYIRTKLNGPVGRDDCVAVFATILGTAQSVLVLVAVYIDLSKSDDSLAEYRGVSTIKVSSTYLRY
jgi:hypothetical protein